MQLHSFHPLWAITLGCLSLVSCIYFTFIFAVVILDREVTKVEKNGNENGKIGYVPISTLPTHQFTYQNQPCGRILIVVKMNEFLSSLVLSIWDSDMNTKHTYTYTKASLE